MGGSGARQTFLQPSFTAPSAACYLTVKSHMQGILSGKSEDASVPLDNFSTSLKLLFVTRSQNVCAQACLFWVGFFFFCISNLVKAPQQPRSCKPYLTGSFLLTWNYVSAEQHCGRPFLSKQNLKLTPL